MENHWNERRKTVLAMLLTISGGYMDAYSYLVRGEVFATGQTGNMVLFSINLMQGSFLRAMQYAVPVMFFATGVFFSKVLFYQMFHENMRRWQQGILLFEVGIFFVIGLTPVTVPDVLVNSAIGICAALQFCGFNRLGYNAPFSSVFCTGNLKSCFESVYMGVIRNDPVELSKARHYLGIITSFVTGVVLGVFIIRYAAEYGAFGLCAILLMCLFYVSKVDFAHNPQ